MKIPFNCKIEEACSNDETRKILNCVNLTITEDRKGMLIATDGRLCVYLPVDVDGNDKPGLIPKAAITRARENQVSYEYDEEGERHTVNTDTILICADRIDVGEYLSAERPTFEKPYPDTTKVFEFEANTMPFRMFINAELLAGIQRAMGCRGVMLETEGVDKPIRVTPHIPAGMSKAGTKAVLMPIRASVP
jgi:hypothetical protein